MIARNIGVLQSLFLRAALHRVAQSLGVVLPAAARGTKAGHQVNEKGAAENVRLKPE